MILIERGEGWSTPVGSDQDGVVKKSDPDARNGWAPPSLETQTRVRRHYISCVLSAHNCRPRKTIAVKEWIYTVHVFYRKLAVYSEKKATRDLPRRGYLTGLSTVNLSEMTPPLANFQANAPKL